VLYGWQRRNTRGEEEIWSSRGTFSAHLLLRATSEAAEQLKMGGFVKKSRLADPPNASNEI
jgi:hypothetical protein